MDSECTTGDTAVSRAMRLDGCVRGFRYRVDGGYLAMFYHCSSLKRELRHVFIDTTSTH